MRRFLFAWIALGFVFLFCSVLLFRVIRPATPILMYHHCASDKPEGPYVVSEESFSRQMAYLKKHGYRTASLPEFVSARAEGRPLPLKSVVLTFDDGLASHFQVVYPILTRLGFTATFFIVPEWVGETGYLTWEQVRELSDRGFTIGSHSLHHKNLPRLSPPELDEEVVLSKQIIEEKIGRRVEFFGYPGGHVNQAVREKVKQAGYRGACALCPAHRFPTQDSYTIHRVWMTRRANHPLAMWFKLNLSGCWYQKLRDNI